MSRLVLYGIDMRRVLGAVSLFFGVVLGLWLFYNLVIERQPEAEGMSPVPAMVMTALFLYGGVKWLRGDRP